MSEPLNKIINAAEQVIAMAGDGPQVVFVIKTGDTITIRDNSGITGLTGESLMDATENFLDELFPTHPKL
jgi:hypothetical protein